MIRHLSGIAEIVEDIEEAVRFYRDILSLKVKHEAGSGYATVEMPGVLHLGIWDRKKAAEVIFGEASEFDRVPPGFMIGIEVDDVDDMTQKIVDRGWDVQQPPRTEDWGQKTSRLYASSGSLIELTETPWARKIRRDMETESQDKV